MATKTRPRAKPASRVDRHHIIDVPDAGGEYAPACLGCPWARCVRELPPAERRVFSLAFRPLESFKAPPDRALA